MPTPIWEPSLYPSRVNLFYKIAYAVGFVNIPELFLLMKNADGDLYKIIYLMFRQEGVIRI